MTINEPDPRPVIPTVSAADDSPDSHRDAVATTAEERPTGGEVPAPQRRTSPVAVGVAGAARGLGVAPGTLRSWERRYGLGPSKHTPGGHRRYGPVDLARLGVMHRLLQEGAPPAEAAAAAILAQIDPAAVDTASPYSALLASAGVDAPGQATREGPGDSQAPASATDLEPELVTPAPAGGGRVLSTPSQPRSVRGLARAAIALDTAACRRALSASLNERGVIATWEDLVRPVMGAIGQRWEQTGRGVEIEHSFSAVLLGSLASRAVGMDPSHNGRPALLACVPDELHDLPVFVLWAALSEAGIRSHVLGARTPSEALGDAVVRLGPPVVFLWAQVPGPAVPELPKVRPAPALVIGGPGWSDIPEDAVHVADLTGAVGALRAAMGL